MEIKFLYSGRPGSEVPVRRSSTSVQVSGLEGVSAGKVSSIVDLTLQLEDGAETNTKALVVKCVAKLGLPHLPQRVGQLFFGKRFAGPAAEHALHVPVLLGSNILQQLFLQGVAVKVGFLDQNTRLGWIGGIHLKLHCRSCGLRGI